MKKEQIWASEVAEKIVRKVRVTAQRNQGKVPYTTVDGRFDDWSDRIWWWTNGFFGGQLWLLYNAYGDELFRKSAEEIENKLDGCLMEYSAMDHDNGFKWLLTSVANYKLTGSEKSKNRALLAAGNLSGRYNPAGQFIRAWNDPGNGHNAGWAIIDCMMNLPLLYWASEQTNDPRFAQIAKLHADTAMKVFIREDGSANHIVVFDPATGENLKSLGGQGYGEGSSWTRGQAWALYGFTLSYIHTKEERYLETAKRCAKYFTSQIPESGLIPVDFRQPEECTWEDSTAAAIAACGLLELKKYVDADEQNMCHEAALKMLRALESSRCNWTTDTDNIVEKCTAAYHDKEHEFAIIYGDYYFTEAILKLCEKDIFLW
ncbi:MAG: glycosyl hydrolase family 88 [Lachnospiraceae bacterium]|nr:glycosyl hydrolase family 88 [Lachnospiraceae bacterium]